MFYRFSGITQPFINIDLFNYFTNYQIFVANQIRYVKYMDTNFKNRKTAMSVNYKNLKNFPNSPGRYKEKGQTVRSTPTTFVTVMMVLRKKSKFS